MKLVPFLAVLAMLMGCGHSAGSSDSGIRGRALLGPTCPVEPCAVFPTPYSGSFVVRQHGDLVTKVKTDGQGRFNVRLAPGRYALESESPGPPLLKTVEVVVHSHRFTDVTVEFDSGIR